MLHRTTLALIRRPIDTVRGLIHRPAATRPPGTLDRAAVFFRCTAVGIYIAACIVSGWVVIRALVG